mmetsp:Transcript_30996/g.40927  ORF Transcript_30996/g.40927 Transcript_30996/m.40927 type:complete len:479 (-) Transcript_30996:457-1893(-)
MDAKQNSELFRELNEKAPLFAEGDEDHVPHKQRMRALSAEKFIGLKTISTFGSICLIVNNVNGPGMLELPALFQHAGWLPCTLFLVLACAISSILSVMFSESIAKVPGNSQFCRRMEFSSVFEHYMGPHWFYITQLFFFLFLFTQNIASIVSTAQSLDSYMASTLFGEAYALQFYPFRQMGFTTWKMPESCLKFGVQCAVFADHGKDAMLVSLGYIVTMGLFLPLCFMNLEENITWQKVSFVVLCVMTVEFMIGLFLAGDFEAGNLPAWGFDLNNLPGLIVTNYAFGITMPSWLCEKRTDVPEKHCIWFSTILSTGMYIMFSFVAASSMGKMPDNILNILASEKVDWVTRFCSGSFGLFIIGLGIPVFSVLMRYNLVVGGMCTPIAGQFYSSVLPFLISWTMYQGHVVLELLSWSGTLLSSLLNFYGPMFLVLIALHRGASSSAVASNRKKLLVAMMIILSLCILVAAISHANHLIAG